MSKFFLSIRLQGVGITDSEGQEFIDAEAALVEAEVSAREIVREAAVIGLGPKQGTVTVTDHRNHVVGVVSFSSNVTVYRAILPQLDIPEV
ncbi:hypothetical protein WDZ92_07170 [Nostoc sp. NIES-2111]